MRVLLDHCVPKRLRTLLPGQDVKTARQMGWDQLKNGELLEQAALQFDVFVTIDKKLRYELNLTALPIAIVIIDVDIQCICRAGAIWVTPPTAAE